MGAKLKLRKGDRVKIIRGEERGKTGEIIGVDKEKAKVIIGGVNLVKKTMPKTQENPKGGIHEIEAAIDISNVMYLSSKDNMPTRIGRKAIDGTLRRYEKRTGEIIDK